MFVDVDARRLHDRPGARRGRHHAADEGDHAGQPLRPAGRHAGHRGDRRAARPGARRGRGADPRRVHRRRRSGHLGRRRVQLLPDQEHDHRRGRHDHHRRRRAGRAGAPPARARDEGPLPPRRARLQLPDDRYPRRHRPGPAAEAGRLQRPAARDRRALRRRAPRRGHAVGPARRDARLPPVHDPRAQARRVRRARSASAGVGSAIYYPIPVHRQKPFLALGLRRPVVPGHRAAHRGGAQHPGPPVAERRRGGRP